MGVSLACCVSSVYFEGTGVQPLAGLTSVRQNGGHAQTHTRQRRDHKIARKYPWPLKPRCYVFEGEGSASREHPTPIPQSATVKTVLARRALQMALCSFGRRKMGPCPRVSGVIPPAGRARTTSARIGDTGGSAASAMRTTRNRKLAVCSSRSMDGVVGGSR